MSEQRTNFIKGAAILTVAGISARFLGLLYRVIITRLIGTEGVGLYQMAYPIYTILLVASVSGIPVALSRLVSENIALGQWRKAYRIFRVARGLSLVLGGMISLALFFGARPLIHILGLDPRSYYTVTAISPAIFIVSVMAAYRGFFQGLQNMVPTAISQIVEQVVRMITMISLAFLLLPYGIEISAAGATFSAATGAVAGLLVLLVIFYRKKQEIELVRHQGDVAKEPVLDVIKKISHYVVPVTLGALVLPLMTLVDLIFVPQRLQVIGFSVEEATSLYGALTGVAVVLVQFPGIITTALRTSLMPSIATAFTLGKKDVIARRTNSALRYAVLVGLPSAAGLFVLALPLCRVIFDEPIAAIPLRFVAWGVLFIALQQISAGILQGLDHVRIPARNLLIGASVNAVINYTLTAVPRFGIRGAALGTVMGFATAALLNLISLQRRVDFSLQLNKILFKPTIATVIMMGSVYTVYQGSLWLARSVLPFAQEAFALFFSVFAGIIVFLMASLLTGAIKEADLRVLPGMKRFIGPLQRMKLLRG